jgi:type IV secretion system protein VirB9
VRLALALLALAAQEPPGAAPGRVLTLQAPAEGAVPLQAAPGYVLVVTFGDGETIQNVALGNANDWQATTDKRGTHLFLKVQQPGQPTNMVVVTDARLYAFELTAAYGGATMPYAVRVVPAAAAAPPAVDPAAMTGRYRLSGDRLVRPAAISDDGTRTFLQWPDAAPLPAIYAVDEGGRRVLVAGHVRDGMVVVDRTADRFVFARDRRVGYAARLRTRR